MCEKWNCTALYFFAKWFKTEATLTFLMEISGQLLQNYNSLVVLPLVVLFEPGQRSMETPLKYDSEALFHFKYYMRATV